jgi:Zn-dependent protease
MHPHSAAILTYAVMAGIFSLGSIYAMAWWTTRRPSATLSIWGLAASALNLAQGASLVWLSHLTSASRIKFSPADGLWFFAFGLAGLYVFSRRKAVPDPAVAKRKATPIAGDRTSLATRHAVTALSVVAQIAVLFYWTRWSLTQHLFSYHGLSWIVLITIASIATTLIHECGHAVLAWCFEMGFLSFRVGPFHAVKREGKWKFKFHAAGIVTPGGSVGAVPTRPDQPRWEEIVMIAAGPCANLFIGTAAVWAVVHDRWGSYPQTWELIAYTGAFCLIAAVLNLFPFLSEDGGYSDGARILQIVTHSPLDDYHRLMASIAATGLTGRRYRDLDAAQIERAAMLFPNEFRGLHLLLCASHVYEDGNRLPDASAALAAAQSIYDENAIDLPGPLHTVFVIGNAWLNRDAAAARLWWDRMLAKKNNCTNVDYWLAKAALMWIEGDRDQAEDAWQEANLEAQRLPQFGAYEFDRFRCAYLREAFDQAPFPTRAPLATVPAATPTPTFELVPPPAPLPVIATVPVVAAIEVVPPLELVPLAAAVSESVSAVAIPSGPAPQAVDPAPSPIAIAASIPAPSRPVEAILPAVVAAPEPALDPMDVLANRLGTLTRPVAKPVSSASAPAAAIDPLANMFSDPDPAPVITAAPVAEVGSVAAAMAVAPPPSVITASPIEAKSIAPVAIADPAPAPRRSVEVTLPAAARATDPAVDTVDVLAARLGALTRPIPKPVPIAPLVETKIDPLAGSVTRIPSAALKSAPVRINLTPDSPEPAALAPKSNAPAVPSAFARRPRPAPLPQGSAPDPFLAMEVPAAEAPDFEVPLTLEATASAASLLPADPALESIPATAAETTIARVPIAALQSEATDVPAFPPEKPARYDPFDFIRAAAIENLNANAS